MIRGAKAIAALTFLLGASSGSAQVAQPSSANPGLLVVLTPTGAERDGLPVYTPHRGGADYQRVLVRGFAGRLLKLYRLEQQFLARRDDTPVEPAYLLLSRNQGGFPRYGFWLDAEPKEGVAYVDLHERLDGSGRFGALDQIFPHELLHVIVQQLAGPARPGSGGSNQVHAIGVRTDRLTAFDEGFAEHAQVVAVDDPDARPLTAALRSDAAAVAAADERLRRYRRALDARWAPAPPARMSFVLWFSSTEQLLRYHAVKDNRFAHEASFRRSRSTDDGWYAAYLLENVLPGVEEAPFKSTSRLLASEGVVAALFSRWVMEPTLRGPVPHRAFYERFGADPAELEPIEHAYLKLFSVLADSRARDTASLVRAYAAAFPEEVGAVAELMRSVGFGWPLPDTPEIWLASERFRTGTTLFDQYRGQPRAHTFDLNAASPIDLRTIPGVADELASAIERAAPFASVADLARVPGVTPQLVERIAAMERAMRRLREANQEEDLEMLDLARLFRPLIARGAVWILVCAPAAALLYRAVRRLPGWRLAMNGAASALLALLPAWVLGAALQVGTSPIEPSWLLLGPVVLFGVPGGVWQLVARRAPREAVRVLVAWTLATLPAWIVATPLL